MPLSPFAKKKSATMEPMTAPPEAMRTPVIIAGRALGSSSLRRRVQRLTRFSVNRSWWGWSVDCKPNNVLVMIGKMAMSTVTTRRTPMRSPNSWVSSGVIARIGKVCKTTAYGKNARSMCRDRFMSTAKLVPSTIEMNRPSTVTCSVGHMYPRIGRRPFRSSHSGKKPSVTTS